MKRPMNEMPTLVRPEPPAQREQATLRGHDLARQSTLRRIRPATPEPGEKALSLTGAPVEVARERHTLKPITEVKEHHTARLAPIDPQRVLVLREAVEHGTLPPGWELPADLRATLTGAAPPVDADASFRALSAARQAPLLRHLGEPALRAAIQQGTLRLVELGRDRLLDEGQVHLVLDGQIALGRFEARALAEEQQAQRRLRPGDPASEKSEYLRQQKDGPLSRKISLNLCTYADGELAGLEEARAVRGGAAAYYTLTPVRLLSIDRAQIDRWVVSFPFFGHQARRAAESAERRIEAALRGGGKVGDFFIRNGVSVASTLRVRDLSRCIDCYECENACEERYGAQRLWLNGKILGTLDLVNACRTCEDQRCIDPCAYGAIEYDQARREVVILEDTCTGCTMCARACPYDAIQMYELSDNPLLKARLSRQGRLETGAKRRLPLLRIASKCDHCAEYPDQACISACPTGALLEVAPERLFVARSDEMKAAAARGYGESMSGDAIPLFSDEVFSAGLPEGADRGRQQDRGARLGWAWLLSLAALLLCLGEIALRYALPHASLLYLYLTRREGLPPAMAIEGINYYPGSALAVWLGRAGSLLLASSVFYSVSKRLRRRGAMRTWFDYHVFAGTVGAMAIVLHSAFRLNPPVVAAAAPMFATGVALVAFWSLLAVAVSGVFGRFLAARLPALAGQAAMEQHDLRDRLSYLRGRHTGVLEADRHYERIAERYALAAQEGGGRLRGALRGLLSLLADEVARTGRRRRLRRALRGIRDTRVRAEVAALIADLALHRRHELLLPRLEPFLRWWQAIHAPAALILGLTALAHIVIEELMPWLPALRRLLP